MYATAQELEGRLGTQSYTAIYADQASAAEEDIAAAEAEIDGYLSARYIVPVTSACALRLLRLWTLTIAEDYAWGRVSDVRPSDQLAKRLENVRKSLHDAASGVFKLSGAAASSDAAGTSVIVVSETPHFTHQALKGY